MAANYLGLFFLTYVMVGLVRTTRAQCAILNECTTCTNTDLVCDSLNTVPASENIPGWPQTVTDDGLLRISFTNGAISEIPEGYFNLSTVQSIDLSNNLLTTLNMNSFEYVIMLRTINLTGNGIVCDSNIDWLQKWKSFSPTNKVVGTCAGSGQDIEDYLDGDPLFGSNYCTLTLSYNCEHANMRTYYFAGSSQEDVESWMRALHAASKMQNDFNQGPSERDEEDWGAKTTLPRSISQPVNGMHDNSRPANGHPDSYGRPHSWQNGHGEYGRSPPREENRPRQRSHYEEVPRKDRPRSLQPEVYPQRQDPERDWVPARPRSVGPGDQPINRTKSLPRHAAPPSGARYTSDPYATMPRHANIQRPAVNPTYVDPREIQMRKRQQKNHLDVPEVGGSREPSVLSYPSVFGSNESDAPQRPPYPAGYEGSIDRNANYAKRPQNEVFQQKRAPTPEQRSVLQSPMQQSPPSMEPEQRNTLNSPMSYERPPSIDSRSQSIDRRSPSVQRNRSMQDERVPPPQVQVEVQMTRSAAPELRSSPSQRSQRSFNSYNGPSPQSRGGRDSADVAPTRERIQVERSGTLREERGGDQLAPLPSHGNRMNMRQQNNPNRRQVQPGQPTSRFRMWQQKTQPYIMLSTGIRIRLSIAANDLLGKSHEELVLFLIQLRRDKANMEEWLRMIDSELDLLQKNPSSGNQQKLKPRQSDSLRRSQSNLNEDEVYEAELKREKDEVSRELEVSLPLINLVDNLVRMGSLYGGKNELIAHEFYRLTNQEILST